MVEKEFYTPAELAVLLGVSRDTVRRAFGEYPGVIDVGEPTVTRRGHRPYRCLRIPRAVFERYVRERRVA